jgi:hypothetical protein
VPSNVDLHELCCSSGSPRASLITIDTREKTHAVAYYLGPAQVYAVHARKSNGMATVCLSLSLQMMPDDLGLACDKAWLSPAQSS